MPKKPTTWIDAHVGRKLCVLRKSSGISQQKLAEKLGVTYQQVQKYEGGTNRVSTTFLLRVAQMFGVPLEYFFEGIDALSGQPLDSQGDAGRIASFVATAEGQELLRSYLAVEDPLVRKRGMGLLKSFGGGGPSPIPNPPKEKPSIVPAVEAQDVSRAFEPAPHYLDHRQRLRTRFLDG